MNLNLLSYQDCIFFSWFVIFMLHKIWLLLWLLMYINSNRCSFWIFFHSINLIWIIWIMVLKKKGNWIIIIYPPLIMKYASLIISINMYKFLALFFSSISLSFYTSFPPFLYLVFLPFLFLFFCLWIKFVNLCLLPLHVYYVYIESCYMYFCTNPTFELQ